MITAIVATAALMVASANAQLGQAIVNNACDYDVYLFNTPSSGGGYNEVDKVLSSGGSYSQTWTELTNGNGWSLKLSPSQSMSNIMQYEYTYHDDTPTIIWFDLSDVNGNPWNANWEITATGSCTPKQQAYRYSTDDAYGMQSCPSDSSITVTLCSGSSSGGGGSSSAEVSSQPETTTAAASTPVASSPVEESTTTTPYEESTTTPVASPTTSHSHWKHHTWGARLGDDKAQEASPTTLVTKATSVNWSGYTVTNFVTVHTTQFVTATAAPVKRHEHHARHPHA